MGALLQLMSLPAACMAFAWARRCGAAAAAADVLRRMVAMIAVHDAARVRLARSAAPAAVRKARSEARAARAKVSRLAGRARLPRRALKGAESVGFA